MTPESVIVVGCLVQFAAAMLLFGSPFFCLYGLGDPTIEARAMGLRRVILGAAVAAFIAAPIVLMAQTALMSGEACDAFKPDMVWAVVSDTYVGAVWVIRTTLILGALTLACLPLQRRSFLILQATAGGAVTASFAWSGHGAAGEGIAALIHQAGDVIHLLSAAVWLGALPMLALLLRRAARGADADSARAALTGLECFSGIGPFVVAALILTGFLNSWFLIGLDHLAAAAASPYAWTLIVKLALAVAMLALAASNRFRLAPRLRRDLTGNAQPSASIGRLKQSLYAETVLGLMVITAVALLGVLEPPGL